MPAPRRQSVAAPGGRRERSAGIEGQREWKSEWSLTRRLAGIAAIAVLASLAFGGYAMYLAASVQDEQMLDARLEQFGATIQAMLEDVPVDPIRSGTEGTVRLTTRPTASPLYQYQVWLREGPTLLMRSHEAPTARPLTEFDRLGYSSTRIDGEDYRVFSLPSRDRRLVIQVAENTREAWNPALLTSTYYAAFLLIPFGALLAATWFMVRRALRSINTLADSLSRRNPLEATALPVVAPPREMVPILNAMDRLFTRMRHTLSVERSFTSLAAHELRTPLAGMRANAQLLTRAGLQGEAQEMAHELILGVDRATHMLRQLLDLARVESLETWTPEQSEPVDLAELYREVMTDLSTQVERKQIRLLATFDVATLPCHRFALGLLLRNLLANAVLYTPAGGDVRLQVSPRDAAVLITVDDSGPGIPESQRDRVFERFERLGRSHADGVGLGLSIVLSVAEMHRARIQLGNSALGGLNVQVLFGAAAPAP